MNQGPQEAEAREQVLAQIVSDLADRMQGGDEISLEQAAKEYPDFEADLSEVWGMIAITQAVGRHKSTHASDSGDSFTPLIELPFRFGDYMLEEEIGRGGMGVVYRARQISLDRTVALKMILKGELASEKERRRFQAEAESVAMLTHPNIVGIHEVGQENGRPYISMRFITGKDLSSKLAGRPMDPREASRMMISICRAIQFAHDQGVLHRDLKPSNILIGKSGLPYVADFGLAKKSDGNSITGSGELLGTPAYMSPEQASERGTVGVASDIYSLGAILYHMITGRPPFQAASAVDTVLMVLEQDVIAPRLLNRRVSRDLEMIVMRCLQKPQDLRYQSADELANDLEAFLNDEPISARQGQLGQVIASWFRETHHANVLENWGLLWIWHSLVLLVACVLTNVLEYYLTRNESSGHPYWPYLLLWTAGFGTWAAVFWWMRRRMGPVTFVERQIAHAWASGLICIILLFPLEKVLGLEPLALAPVLPLIAGMTFIVKAGILSGVFYFPAAAMVVTAFLMATTWFDGFDQTVFGLVSFCSFFFIGLKYYRRSQLEHPECY